MEESPFKLIYDKVTYEVSRGNSERAKEIIVTGGDFTDFIYSMAKSDFDTQRKLFIQRCRILAKHSKEHAKNIRQLADRVEKEALFFALSKKTLVMEFDAWFAIVVGKDTDKFNKILGELNAV